MHIDNTHETGMILTTTLWRIREKLGQDRTDTLVAQTTMNLNQYLAARQRFYTPLEWEAIMADRIDWCDFYYGLIVKNRELYDGADEGFITEQFRKTGFPVEGVALPR